MAGYDVQRDAMQKGAVALEDATQKIDQHIRALTQSVDGMLAQWKGNASSSFGNVHVAWTSNAAKLHQALAEMHQTLVSTHATYNTQEEEQAGMFNNIAGAL
ncbi:MAG TPA: WXG100 family type VII secretion target [Mycobacteriales bacterium]|nr:WXG100 family type VII secretion target [Mycobacteriales bacterium]